MPYMSKKGLAAAVLAATVISFGAGCGYDHDHYRDYGSEGYRTSSRYGDRDYDRDDSRYGRFEHERYRDWDDRDTYRERDRDYARDPDRRIYREHDRERDQD
jgi:hypothetical protein